MKKLLIDTHIFLWLNDGPEKLSERALESCSDPSNLLYLSLVSLWEIQIKCQLGKLTTSVSWQRMVETQKEDNGLQILSLQEAHITQLESLILHHRDPFDRMLIAQARSEEMLLVSKDGAFNDYEVDVIW